MNIDSSLKNLFAGYSSRAPQTDTQHFAPGAPRAHPGPQINFGRKAENSPTPMKTENAQQASQGAMDVISALLNRLMKVLGGNQSNAQASNTSNSGPNPNAINYDSTNRANQPGRNQRQASNSDKAIEAPKNGGPYSDKDLVDGFRQKDGTNNCVTVAGIKAAMQKYGGPKEVYSSVEKKGDGYDIQMRDDPSKTYHLTNEELKQAAQQSGFEGNNPQMLNDANFMYAVSAKREQEKNGGSFAQSLGALNRVQDYKNGFERLGLENHVRQASVEELVDGAAGVIAQNEHVFTVLNGRKEDYGTLGPTPDSVPYALKLV